MTIDELLSRLQDVKQEGADKWTARCPCTQNHSHGDRNRSFSVKNDTSTGKLLVYCHKGCSIDEICSALGVAPGDLMPEAVSTDKRDSFLKWYAEQNGLTLEKVYSYCYGKFSDGLAKIRFRNSERKKDFRWIKTDPNKKSGFSMTHEGCEHRLYFAGNPDDELVFIVEGEKDADTLHRIARCTAASAENGAGKSQGSKWRDEYTRQLEGKTIYILWDNDEVGKQFAEVTAEALDGHAAHIFMLDIAAAWDGCPEKADISDMAAKFGADDTLRRLSDLMADAIERPQKAAEKKPRSTEELFDDFMQKVQSEAYRPLQTGMADFDKLLGGGILPQSLVILTAAPGTGKTTLAQQVFETMAANGKDVIFLNLEMSREQLLARSLSRIIHRNGYSMTAADVLKGYAWTEPQKTIVYDAASEYRKRIAPFMNYNPAGCTADVQDIADTLDTAGRQAQEQGKEAPVVVLDYLHLVTTKQREDASEIIKKAVAALKTYAVKYNTFVLAISASNRAANSRGQQSLDSARDTSAIEYTADYQLALNYKALHEHSNITYTNRDGVVVTEKASADNPDHMEILQKGNEKGHREMLVQVLKNRLNPAGGKLYLNFDAANSVFYPVDKRTPPSVYASFTELHESDEDNPFI